jgi:hypothetical protein
MVSFDDGRARSVVPLYVVGETVVHARIDLELVDPARRELALDRGDERPHQALPAIGGIDENVEEARASVAPSGSGDRESNERRPVPRRHDYGVGVRRLPSHLALGKGTPTPLLALELQHSRPELSPGGGVECDRFDHWRHQRRVTTTTRASPARSLMTRVSPPSEY